MARILIVDDEKDFQILIQQRFRKKIETKHFEFMFAHNGFEALDILQNGQLIDILVTDIHMPGMDGLTLLSKVSVGFPQTCSIVLSAYNDTQNLRKAMNHGAYDFLTKPINFIELEGILEKSLQAKSHADFRPLKKNALLKMKEKEKADFLEKDFAQRDNSLLSTLSIKPLFPEGKILLDCFAAHQKYILFIIIASHASADSRLSLIKVREVLRSLFLEKSNTSDVLIKKAHLYREKFINEEFFILISEIDLAVSQLNISYVSPNVFFLQKKEDPLQQVIEGPYPFLSKEATLFYASPLKDMTPLISFKKPPKGPSTK